MTDSITWLHLTDAHFGMSGQRELMPTFRDSLKRDLEKLLRQTGPIDVVLFTGDIAQSGQNKEFAVAENEIALLQNTLTAFGKSPAWVFVPGNHDLERPDPDSTQVVVSEQWEEQEKMRNAFWRERGHDLRKTIKKAFANYLRFVERTQLPKLPESTGTLPGDCSFLLEKNDIRLGIIGLNSTFLQLRGGDLFRKLGMDCRQLNSICRDDPVAWTAANDLNILLTHQPYSWLTPLSQRSFLAEINPPGRFALHLNGHMHEPHLSSVSTGGGLPRHTHQGRAFFGIEGAEGSSSKQRIHGYSLGTWRILGEDVEQTIWPRMLVPKQDGTLAFDADTTYILDDAQSLKRQFKRNFRTSTVAVHSVQPLRSGDGSSTQNPECRVLDTKAAAEAIDNLSGAVRFRVPFEPHAAAVRPEERESLQSFLKTDRFCWIVVDWGAGKDAFIMSALKEMEEERQSLDVTYHVRCDTADKLEDLIDSAKVQLGLPFQEFLRCAQAVQDVCLILDGINASLCSGSGADELRRAIKLALDFAGTLRIIGVSRFALENEKNLVFIVPLDLPDTRFYVNNHPEFPAELVTPDIVERLHEASGGLPAHLDRMIKRLHFTSMETVLAEEADALENAAQKQDPSMHRALLQAIESVAIRDKEGESRGIQLLQVLSILAYGETIEGLKHFIHGAPMYSRDAALLESCALLEVIPLSHSSPVIQRRFSSGVKAATVPKLLRVPKQVRDCVVHQMTPDDKRKSVNLGAEFFFGQGWRVGRKPKLRRVPSELKPYVGQGVGNEFAVLQLMIGGALSDNDAHGLRNGVKLALHYCNVLRGSDRNHDLRIASTRLIHTLESSDFEKELGELHRLAGRACRMDGSQDDAVRHFEEYVESPAAKPGSEATNYALLELVECLIAVGEEERARSVVETVKKTARESSHISFAAQSKLLELLEEPGERFEELKDLEGKAREKGWTSLANDVALSLAYHSDSGGGRLHWFSRVLESAEKGWNRHRAIVGKAGIDGVTLSFTDRSDLFSAYSYCHNQRNGLFNRCHEALWRLLEEEGDKEGLYRIFKHSSFLWRLRGDDSLELIYFQRLQSLAGAITSEKMGVMRAVIVEIRYYLRRAKVLIAKLN